MLFRSWFELFTAVFSIASTIQPAPKAPHLSGLDSDGLKICGLGNLLMGESYLVKGGKFQPL